MALLEVSGLVKYFGRRKVVDGVGFEVNAGEVVGLLGPNGAGKTTSFRMTTGQLTPNDGRVDFDGHDVTTLPMYRRARLGMGYLSQEPSIFRKLTVEQNLMAILEVLPYSRKLGRKLTRSERWERTEDALQRFRLEHVRHTPAARASGGEKRRLEIARCLVCEPKLILLDEPFAAVDPKTTEEIRKQIRELARSGIGILLTDHNVREVLKITDRSYLIKDGQVVTKGTPEQLINDPIAIDGYLGRTFAEDALGRPLAQPFLQAAPATVPSNGVPVAEYATTPNAVETVQSPVVPQSSPLPESQGAAAPVSASVVSQPPETQIRALGQLLAQEKIHRLIEQLKSTNKDMVRQATAELLTYSNTAIPSLIDTLERRDPEMRQRAAEVLKSILGAGFVFDPFAPEDQRRRQIQALRSRWSGSQAA